MAAFLPVDIPTPGRCSGAGLSVILEDLSAVTKSLLRDPKPLLCHPVP